MVVGYFIVFEPVRTFSFAILMSTILSGIVFAKLYETTTLKNGKKWISLFVVIVVCSSSIMGIFNIYDSPWKNVASPDMNAMRINGLNWFLSNKNESVPLVSDINYLSINMKSIIHSFMVIERMVTLNLLLWRYYCSISFWLRYKQYFI